ncbi:MAG: hypothetical protein FWD94_03315 [Treponema sp.]|nr:hypothetical protein [Treponema sp.]
MAGFARALIMALRCMAAASVLALLYGFAERGFFTLAHLFPANFLSGALLILIALLMMILPFGFKPDPLTDHSTFGERLYRNREERWKRAYGFLFAGMLVIGIAGIVQVLLGMVVPS